MVHFLPLPTGIWEMLMCYTEEFGFDLGNVFDVEGGGVVVTCLLQATDVFLLKVQSAAAQLCLVSAC